MRKNIYLKFVGVSLLINVGALMMSPRSFKSDNTVFFL
jgi:hypothetical protein